MKKVLFTNSEIQTKEQIWANTVIMSEWNLINTLNFDCSYEMSEINEQTKNRSCKSSVNKKCECEKIRECECEHEKNRKWEQDEKCKCEHKKRDSNVSIDDDDRESKSC